MVDAKALEQLAHPRPAAVGDVLLDRHVREERVLLEDEAHPAALRRQVDARLCVEEDPLADGDSPPVGAAQAGNGAQHGRLAGSGRPDEGEGLRPDLEL